LWRPDWPEFRPAEYAFTLGAGALVPILIWALPNPPPGWDRPLLFDDPLRDAIGVESRGGQRAAQLSADVIQYLLALHPYLIDAGLVAGLIDGDWNLAYQMALINTEAFVLQGLLVTATKRIIGRVRPGLDPCPAGDYSCRSRSQRRSFISGHASAAFTGAALICLYHRQMPLYRSSAADGIACATGLALAVTDGLLRVVSDDHHATDVIASGAIGLVAGYVVPYLLHFQGRTDGRLDGMLHLGAAGGIMRDRDTQPAIGITVDARQWWWWNDAETIGLEIAGSMLLAGTRRSHYYREGRASLRVWAAGFSLGPELSYAAEAAREDRDRLAGGGSIAFGFLEEETQVVLQASWLPLGGSRDLIEAGLEVAAFRYGMVALRMRRSLEDRALVFLSLGGRLPW
jgi:membrane-associated phospholipid phosphatase